MIYLFRQLGKRTLLACDNKLNGKMVVSNLISFALKENYVVSILSDLDTGRPHQSKAINKIVQNCFSCYIAYGFGVGQIKYREQPYRCQQYNNNKSKIEEKNKYIASGKVRIVV